MENPSLLVVDDEVDTCRNFEDIFTDLGFRIDVAHDAKSALEKLTKQPFDVAVLDLMMPEMDGVSLWLEMKRIRPGMVAILATAYPNHPRVEESLKVGMWRIVPKPVDLPQLLKLVNQAAIGEVAT